MHVVDQRLEERNVAATLLEEMATTITIGNTNNNSFPHRSMQIDVSHFDGTDVSSQIFKIEQFFQLYNTPDDQRIMISSFHLEGSTLSQCKWMHANGFIESWRGVLKAINLIFGPSMYEDSRGALSKLQQTTTIAVYQAQFEDLSTKVNGLLEKFLLSFYISRLKPKIK